MSSRSSEWLACLLGIFLVLLALRMDAVAKRTTQKISIELNELLQVSFVDFFDKMVLDAVKSKEFEYEAREKEDKLLERSELKQSEHDFKKARNYEHLAEELVANSSLGIELEQNATRQAFNDSTLLHGLLLNFSLDLRDSMDAQYQLQALNSKCIRGFHWMCNMLGKASQIKKRANADSIRIHDELAQAEIVRHRERREQLYAQMLQGHTTQYNQTASKLLDAAARYNAQAHAALLAAQRENMSAILDEDHAHVLESNEKIFQEITSRTDQRLRDLDNHIKRERRLLAFQSLLTVFAAILSLIYFVWHAALRSWRLICLSVGTQQAWMSNRASVDVLAHITIFLISIGWRRDPTTGSSLLQQLYQNICSDVSKVPLDPPYYVSIPTTAMPAFDVVSAGAVVLDFVMRAAFLQTLVADTIPHVRWHGQAAPCQRAIFQFIVKQSLLNFLWWGVLFGVEIFLVLFLPGPLLLSALTIGLSSVPFRFVMWSLLGGCVLLATRSLPTSHYSRDESIVQKENEAVLSADTTQSESCESPSFSFLLRFTPTSSVGRTSLTPGSSPMVSEMLPLCKFIPQPNSCSTPSSSSFGTDPKSFQEPRSNSESVPLSQHSVSTRFSVSEATSLGILRSPHAVTSWGREFSKLQLPVEILLVCFMCVVIANAVHTLRASHEVWNHLTIGFMGLLSVGILVGLSVSSVRTSSLSGLDSLVELSSRKNGSEFLDLSGRASGEVSSYSSYHDRVAQ
jgi:hypothetical protein